MGNSRFILFISFCFFLFTTFNIAAQRKPGFDRFWSVGLNAGILGWSPTQLKTISGSAKLQRTGNTGFGSLTANNGQSYFTLIANTSVGLHAGYSLKSKSARTFYGFYAEIQRNKACYEFNYPFTFAFHGDTAGRWVEADAYFYYNASFVYGWSNSNGSTSSNNEFYNYIKISGGQSILHRNFDYPIKTGYQENWVENGTGMINTIVSSNKNSTMLGFEIGKKIVDNTNNSCLNVGIIFRYPLLNTFTEEYEFFKYGSSVGKSQITFKGSTVMLNAAYTFNFKRREKPIDTTRYKIKEPPKEHLVVHHRKLNGRRLKIQNTLTLDNDSLVIYVYDKNKVDGDRISLYLNDNMVLEDLTVTKLKKQVTLHLRHGSNYLAMHALNLGTIPPNTAAIEFIYNGKKKIITLVSDESETGVLEIIIP